MIMKLYKEKIFYKIKCSSLPEEGWFQCCMRCDAITSNTKKIKTSYNCSKIIVYYTYVCKNCQKKLKEPNAEKEFKKKCDKYIKRHFFN
tara:strand:+ start:300 stop:566 length:267 start_codon:yes stop_codon:yes gene_type:complete